MGPTGPVPPRRLSGLLCIPGTVWWVATLQGELLRLAPSVGSLLGVAPDTLVGRHVTDLVHPDDVPLVVAAGRRLVAGDEVSGVEVRFAHADGSWRPVRWAARHDPLRGVVDAVGRATSIRLSVEGLPRDQGTLLRDLLEHMPAPMFVRGADDRYLMVNWELCRLAGLASPDDALGRRPTELWPGYDEAIALNVEGAAGRDQPGPVEIRVGTADGERELLVGRYVVRSTSGELQAVVGVATDITERVAAERRLVARDRVLQAIFRASPDLIAVLDRHGLVVEHNASAVGMLGQLGEHSRLDDLTDMVHPDDVVAVRAAFAEMCAGTYPDVVVRYRVRHDAGHWVTVDSRGRAERDEQGRVVHTVVVTRDVTAALATEMQLRAAVVAAERASQAKSEFLSRMSHELRTPLNSVLGFAQLLQMDDLSAEQAGAVAEILRAGRHLLALIDGVLDIARIETGHFDLRPASVPVELALTGAAGASGATVEVAGVLPSLWADPRRLEQVLTTLVDTARGGDPGTPVTLSATAAEPGWVRVSVIAGPRQRPAGAPLANESVALALARYLAGQMGGRLTEVPAFEQGASARSAGDVGLDGAHAAVGGSGSGSGSGSGLPDRHDTDGSSEGRIGGAMGELRFLLDVPARPGPGTDGLPSSELQALAVTRRVTAGHARGAAGAPVAAYRVLVVASTPDVGDLVRQVALRRAEVELTAMADGDEAAEAVRAGRPHLLLVELPLAGGRPSAAIAATRSVPDPYRPVVAVIGTDPTSGQARQALEDGADAYLTRPLDVRALLELIDVARGAFTDS